VTVRTSQPTRDAIVARVTATWRPVAWSACSAITAAIDNSVAAVIDTRSAAHSSPNAGECAQRWSPSSQPARLVHIGARGAHAPARSTQPRRRSLASARTACGVGAMAAPSAGHALRTRGDRVLKKSRFAH
jgi:protein gp37